MRATRVRSTRPTGRRGVSGGGGPLPARRSANRGAALSRPSGLAARDKSRARSRHLSILVAGEEPGDPAGTWPAVGFSFGVSPKGLREPPKGFGPRRGAHGQDREAATGPRWRRHPEVASGASSGAGPEGPLDVPEGTTTTSAACLSRDPPGKPGIRGASSTEDHVQSVRRSAPNRESEPSAEAEGWRSQGAA